MPDQEARDAFDKVRRKINSAAGAEEVKALGDRVIDIGSTIRSNFLMVEEVLKRLANYIEDESPATKDALIQFIREGK